MSTQNGLVQRLVAIERAQRGGGALRRSVLERAFRGELVPQDPSDEPASVLLDRIRAAREVEPAPRRGRVGGPPADTAVAYKRPARL